jgi:3',5'-cyclic AMP phosphodiesterase CpdA
MNGLLILRKTLNTMQEFKGSWVLLPGNHDPSIPSPKKLRRIHNYA